MIASFPRKWSMRKIESSGNTARATPLSSRADARSRPNGIRPRDAIELPRGCQVASERLFDNDARMRGQVRSTESIDHHLEERGRDSEVVRRAPGPAQSALYRRERLRIIIIPAHVL